MKARDDSGRFIKAFACEATIPKNGLKSLCDGGWEIRVHTQEIDHKHAANLMEYKGCFGKFVFATNAKDIKTEDIDIPEYKTDEGNKTPAQRLRAVIYRVWEQTTSQDSSFATFYESQVEGIINQYKRKLN